MFFLMGVKQKEETLGEFEFDCECSISKGKLKRVEDVFSIFFLPIVSWNRRFFVSCNSCNSLHEIKESKIARVLLMKKISIYDLEN